jgi:hypothetical protein
LILDRVRKPATSTTAHLTALAPCRSRFIGRPLVRRSFFVSGATAFAGNFALLLGCHRRESSSFSSLLCGHSALPEKFVRRVRIRDVANNSSATAQKADYKAVINSCARNASKRVP